MGSDQDQQNALELHNDSVISGPSGPHGLLFLDATGLLQIGIGIGAIPVFRSAMAYYDKIFNVVGVQPTALVYTSATDRGFTNWEGGPQSTPEFPDHNIVSWNIEADAQAKPFLAKVGTANNRDQSFTIFKDDNHKVFDRDGFSFTVRYYAQA